MSAYHLAVDIGASSGRHIIGYVESGKMKLNEVYRFENGVSTKNGHLCWDIDGILKNVIDGIKECKNKDLVPETIGIDTWAVDFVLLDKDGNVIGDAVSYRDDRTDGIKDELYENGILAFEELYKKTGIQYQKFNTIYQLMALKKEHPEYLEEAEDFLMIPDYLAYKLTGMKVNEYTNASTTALVDAKTRQWDYELIEKIGLPKKIFKEIKEPGSKLSYFTKEIEEKVGFSAKVVLPATHDTGSAYIAVPARDDKAVFLSSGTWSLMGIENKEPVLSNASRDVNLTNEGGYDKTYRYLKNIMGLWMIQSVRKEIAKKTGYKPSFPELIKSAKKAENKVSVVLDADDDRFLAPKSMIEEVRKAAEEKGAPLPITKEENENLPDGTGAVMAAIYSALAFDYKRTVSTLEMLTGKSFTSINVVGGGSKDMYLNERIAKATGLPVFAGPVEGTALGNLIVQFINAGDYKDLYEARRAIKESFEIITIQ